jgi:hypothetical protein
MGKRKREGEEKEGRNEESRKEGTETGERELRKEKMKPGTGTDSCNPSYLGNLKTAVGEQPGQIVC